ncbi:hypothetical protein FIBSPDRAFT_1053458 [Athelia psychrophila]|uniref:Uncharacterized protein n=1 Tax=Athelia psychrophila TaxID=1759441 RepID=A0A167WXF6_9AGAM|nr:hypothetical protein FIBSPDRAFT_1053458 [Fibularhizoctonia sp. CBS 109695]
MYGSTILALMHFWSSEKYFWIADADVVKTVVFQKDVEASCILPALEFYGPNLLSSQEVNWKRHRAVAAPAFIQQQPSLKPFASSTNGLHLPTDGSDAEIDVRFIMTQALATLLLISSAGFGSSMHWSPVPSTTLDIPTSGLLPFSDAVMSTTHNLYVKSLAPKFLDGY